MNNLALDKTMENVRKCRYIKPVTTEKRRNYFVLEQNDRTTDFFTESLFTTEMRKLKY